MTYNKEALLKMIESYNVLREYDSFYEDRNSEIINKLDLKKYDYAYGASKLALISLDGDYVIKIPYTGSYYHESGFYDSRDEYCEGYDEYEDFAGADDYESPWDYCMNEVLRYQIAFDEGLAECFAETRQLGYVDGYPVYVQEKADPLSFCRGAHKHSQEEKEKTSKICKKYSGINQDWLTDFRFYYGEQKLIHFVHFIEVMGWNSDLRDENIGYIGDRPVLIDYADFNS